MDRRRAGSPVYLRQWGAAGSSSPTTSPAHPRAIPAIKRAQNVAAKAAAQRLAQVMAHQSSANDEDDEDEDDDDDFKFASKIPNSKPSQPAPVVARPNRAPSPLFMRNNIDPAPVARSTSAGRSTSSARTSTLAQPMGKNSIKSPTFVPPIDPPAGRIAGKRFAAADYIQLNAKDTGGRVEASALQDELDIVQEEKHAILDKLRVAEERRDQSEARARELEKQISSLGEGVSLEAKLLHRKEAALREREIALKAAAQTKDVRDEEIASLSSQLNDLREEAAAASERLREVDSEGKSLRTMTQRMILTEEEMEEVVLKRCWLARYWGLAVRLGICADIAAVKHEHWSALAPLPFELVYSAGQKAKDDREKSQHARELSDLTGEGNIETMLSVEMGLRELASLKVEDAVVLAFSLMRRTRQFEKASNDHKVDPFELSDAEAEDVVFKEAWLMYWWRRAVVHGVEEDIAEERVQFWISRNGQPPTAQDAVDVQRGMVELKKLSIEQQLWEASRKDLFSAPNGLTL